MPPSAAPTLSRRALVAAAVAGAIVLGGGTAAWAQDPVPTTTPTATSGVLVPGTTAPPSSTTATTQPPPADDADDEGGFLDLDANEKVWVIVGALVAIAILMMVLTVIYWRHTKPDRAPKQDRRIERAERREAKAERRDEKRQQRAARKDPFGGGVGDAEKEDPADGDDEVPPRSSPDGPMDLDAILGSPDPSRSVFGPDEEDDRSR